MWRFATSLSRLSGIDVSFVVKDHGQAQCEIYDQTKVYAHSGYKDELRLRSPTRRARFLNTLKQTQYFPYDTIKRLVKPPVPFVSSLNDKIRAHFNPRILQIESYVIYPKKYEIYEQVDADIYCVFGANRVSAEVSAYCRECDKPCVLFLQSDGDLLSDYYPHSHQLNHYGLPGFLCYYPLANADLIVAQTQVQADLLKERFGRPSVVIYNPVDLRNSVSTSPYSDRKKVLWVGKSNDIKQPDLLLKLAALFPELQFEMVVNRVSEDMFEQILAVRPPNVTIREYVPFDKIEELFAEAFVCVNTSRFEGFPNVFLEAGKYSVPILSLNVDPDGFIEKYGCGIHAHGDFARFVEGLRLIQDDQRGEQRFSKNIARYVQDHYDMDEKAQQLDKAIRLVLERHHSIQDPSTDIAGT